MPREDTISVFCEYKPELELSVATFTWNIEQPDRTYTISIGRSLSIAFDTHIPVRPSVVNWRKNREELGTFEKIEDLFGTQLAEQMENLDTRRSELAEPLGLSALVLTLDKEQRHNIAELQYEDASTPPKLRLACEGMLNISNH